MSAQSVLQLTLQCVQKNYFSSSYVGGHAYMSKDELIATCPTCNGEMVHLIQINHDRIPFCGLMKSKGISRVFICTSNKCSGFSSFDRIDSTIIQLKDDELKSLEPTSTNLAKVVLPGFNFISQQIKSLNDANGTYIQEKENSTLIVLDIKSLFNIEYFSREKKYLLKTIMLEDSDNGLNLISMNVSSKVEKINSPILKAENSVSKSDQIFPNILEYGKVREIKRSIIKPVSKISPKKGHCQNIVKKDESLEVDNKTVDNKSVENKTVENKTVDNKTVDNKTVDNKTVDNKSVENKTVDNKNVENKTVDNKSVENKTVDNKTVDNKNVENKNTNNKKSENKKSTDDGWIIVGEKEKLQKIKREKRRNQKRKEQKRLGSQK